MTALEIVTTALRRIGVIGESKTPSAEQGANAVTHLNDLMAELAEKGVDLGYAPVATTADTVVLPLGHVLGIKAQLAELLAEGYGLDIPPKVSMDAEDSRNRLMREAQNNAFISSNLSAVPRGNATGTYFDIVTGTWR